MLIPEFKLSQNNTHVTVSLRLPYVKVTACEFYIEQKQFKFYLKPYLLTLSFDQCLKAAEQPDKATYFHQKYILEVKLLKKNKGQFFQNLNLLSSVISNKKKSSGKKAKVLVEVIGQQEHKLQQTKQSHQYSYGFCNNYRAVFKDLQQEAQQLFFFNPQMVPLDGRYELGRKIAEQDFDQSMYLFDKISNFQEIDRIIQSQQSIKSIEKLIKDYKEGHPSEDYEKFKSMLKIPSKQLIIRSKDEDNILKQLISIVICYIYELLCMEGDLSVQSPKTITRTSAVLSCLNDFNEANFDQVILETSRRCLTYSLYKNIDICKKSINLVVENLNSDFLTSVIVDLRYRFDKTDCRYLLNRIYFDDCLIYVLSGKGQQRIQKMIVDQNVKQKLKNLQLSLNQNVLQIEVQMNEELQMSSSNVGGELEELLKLD